MVTTTLSKLFITSLFSLTITHATNASAPIFLVSAVSQQQTSGLVSTQLVHSYLWWKPWHCFHQYSTHVLENSLTFLFKYCCQTLSAFDVNGFEWTVHPLWERSTAPRQLVNNFVSLNVDIIILISIEHLSLKCLKLSWASTSRLLHESRAFIRKHGLLADLDWGKNHRYGFSIQI